MMLFNSYEFIFGFLPFTFFIYFFLLQQRLMSGAKAFLVFASLFFYSWWNISYLPLILSSMLFNYAVGMSLNEHSSKINKKALLTFGIIFNVSLLGYFKYADFFIENVDDLFGANVELLHLALPLAISFFTFQQIAYLVDSYAKETSGYDFLNYALFVTFFPQLIAGPIVHHKEMMPQFASKWNLVKNYKNIALGVFIFSMGLFKKVVIADYLATWANNGFDKAEVLNFFEAWVTSLSYTFQLYFDFSGYTDMAIGAALLFNIKLPINFNSPYKAQDIQDFWRRWHITLSRFLRDYIYIPLGGNRVHELKIQTNLMITFLIGGLWHGAGWTFIFWGFLHGSALIIHRIWKKMGFQFNTILAWLITFNFINITWVFFRANEFDDALKVIKGMFGFNGVILPLSFAKYDIGLLEYSEAWLSNIYGTQYLVLEMLAILFLVLYFKNSMQIKETLKFNRLSALFTMVLLLSAFLHLSGVHEFLYFNF